MKKHKHSNVAEILQSAKLRLTKGRKAIIDVLRGSAGPMTQEQIAAKLKKTGINKVTIYRALDDFVEKGIVHKAFIQERTWHFELAHNCTHIQCHPHFTCTNCGKTRCLTNISIPLASGLDKGFVLHRQQVRLEGLCPNCGG